MDLINTITDKEVKSIFKYSPYINRVNQALEFRKGMKALAALDNGTTGKLEGNKNVIYLTDKDSDLPNITYPIVTPEGFMFDARPMVTVEGRIKNPGDFQLMVARGYLDRMWLTDHDGFAGNYGLITDVFASWVSTVVSTRLNLTDDIKMLLKVTMGIYYLGLINAGEDKVKTRDLESFLILKLGRELRVPSQAITAIFETYGEEAVEMIWNIGAESRERPFKTLCEIMHNVADVGSLGINEASIYTSLSSGSFIGANSSELVVQSLSYPPAMAVMIEQSLVSGFVQKKSYIGRITAMVIKKHNEGRFEKMLRQAKED